MQDFDNSGLRKSFTDEIHEFGNGSLGGHVVAADDPDAGHVEAGFVASHLHRTGFALGDVEYDKSSFNGLLERIEEPSFGGGVARPEGFQHQRFQVGGLRHMAHEVL